MVEELSSLCLSISLVFKQRAHSALLDLLTSKSFLFTGEEALIISDGTVAYIPS